MAEEDLLFGKNRHLFGGIEPSNMLNFIATSAYIPSPITPRISISITLPADTVISVQTLCTVAGAVIRRSTTEYPATEFDGDLVATVTANGTIYDTNVAIGTTYYYSAFPFTTQGVYNRNKVNRSSCKAVEYSYLFGYDLTVANSDPATRVIYPSGVNNTNYTPASMNLSTYVFNYGSWPSTAGDKFMPKPCMLKYDGTVAYYLNPDNYTKKVDGTASDITNTAFGGNAMMEWPIIYTKREYVNGVYKFRCCDVKLDSSYECWCNYDKNNNVISHFYTAIYFGSNVSGKIRSLSGTTHTNDVAITPENQKINAAANGTGWKIELLCDRLLIQDLLVLMSKNTNSQVSFGSGVTSGSAINTSGSMNANGLFGLLPNGSVKIFGMEHWYGNMARWFEGLYYFNSVLKVKITQGTYDGSTATDYNNNGTGYMTISGITLSGNNSGYTNRYTGYIDSMKNDLPYGRLPISSLSGTATTYEGDLFVFNNSDSHNVPMFGGLVGEGLNIGAFYMSYNAGGLNDGATATYGSALSCKPLSV